MSAKADVAPTFEEIFAMSPNEGGRCRTPGPPDTDEPRLFGGLLLGHAVFAASIESRPCHSLHALFVGAGEKKTPLQVDVVRTRDGRGYDTREVKIHQANRLLLVGLTSHHLGDDGPDHQIERPDAPSPSSLEDQRTARSRRAQSRGQGAKRYLAEHMLDLRPVEVVPESMGGAERRRLVWFRPRQPIGGELALHQAVIAFASDIGLVQVGLRPHRRPGDGSALQATSLDHTIHFHRQASADGWLLYDQHTSVAAHGRGLSHGTIFTADGTLIATVSQEFLARRRAPRQL